MEQQKTIKQKVLDILKWEPLTLIENRVKRMLERWKSEFSDFQVEEVVVDLKVSGKLGFGRAGLKVTMKKKDS